MTPQTNKAMRAVLCSHPSDDLSTTTLTSMPIPLPAANEVRVRVRAASLNPIDWKLCSGLATRWSAPNIVGLDAAGEIAALGEGVSGWAVGDRVVWHGNLNRHGVFADYAIAPAHVLSRIPEGVSDAAAAALPCAGYTAYQGLVRKARVGASDTVVVQGASGGVGGFGIQIAKARGARVIALAQPRDFALAKRLGADHVLDYRANDLPAQLRALNGRQGADIMLEVARPEDPTRSLDLLRFNGQLVTVAFPPALTLAQAHGYAPSLHQVALGAAYGADHLPTQSDFAAMGDEMLALLAEGKIDPMITETLSLDDVPDALRRLRARAVTGKLVAVL